MTGEKPKGPTDFDSEDWATFKEMIVDYRRRQAFREVLATYAKGFALGSAALAALFYFRDFIMMLLEKKGGR